VSRWEIQVINPRWGRQADLPEKHEHFRWTGIRQLQNKHVLDLAIHHIAFENSVPQLFKDIGTNYRLHT
jgi:hypothetical protein